MTGAQLAIGRCALMAARADSFENADLLDVVIPEHARGEPRMKASRLLTAPQHGGLGES